MMVILAQKARLMQQPVGTNLARPAAWVGYVCLLAAGCGPDAGPGAGTGQQARPFAGVSLTLRCPDAAFARAVTPAAESWATQKGAKVEVQTGSMTPGDSADLGVIPAAEFGAWAARGDLAPVPGPLRALDHPLQWANILGPYREHLIVWGGQARALPLAGDGFVVVYRADRVEDPKLVEAFRASAKRPPGPPASWEDFAELAAALGHTPASRACRP
jgi:ABC-type glycerol-3-phosphate transport system substrate-binding protein